MTLAEFPILPSPRQTNGLKTIVRDVSIIESGKKKGSGIQSVMRVVSANLKKERMIMSNSEVKAIVFNTPEDVDKYIVAKAVCGELWYWGSWDNKNDAFRVAKQFDNGCVLEVDNAEHD